MSCPPICIPRLSAEISPYFKFATNKNPQNIVKKWIDSDQRERTHLVYANCVRCNVKRFTPHELSYFKLIGKELDTYFCFPCLKKVAEFINTYDRGFATEENRAFSRLWDDSLFGRYSLALRSQL